MFVCSFFVCIYCLKRVLLIKVFLMHAQDKTHLGGKKKPLCMLAHGTVFKYASQQNLSAAQILRHNRLSCHCQINAK